MTTSNKEKRELRNKVYYLSLFKISGHSTWRACIYPNKEVKDKEFNSQKVKIIEEKNFEINKITGELTSL